MTTSGTFTGVLPREGYEGVGGLSYDRQADESALWVLWGSDRDAATGRDEAFGDQHGVTAPGARALGEADR